MLQSHDNASCDFNPDEYKYIAFLFADLYQMLVLRDANKT
ncbi:hypothetical protein D083_2119 [Dickeya solani RNS 08.23.3.1.A]|nr:hypothetical protein D083_2119 [Dickeya solani RNS 08.23.3.1.A]